MPASRCPAAPATPIATRSSSVGTLPVSVDRISYLPLVKSRGRGVIRSAAGPSPLPDAPWHSAHLPR